MVATAHHLFFAVPTHVGGVTTVAVYGDITLTDQNGKAERVEFSNTLFFGPCERIIDEEWVINTPPAVVTGIVDYLQNKS